MKVYGGKIKKKVVEAFAILRDDMPLRCKLMENSINLNNWKSHKKKHDEDIFQILLFRLREKWKNIFYGIKSGWKGK